jgi:hypothetical protein
MQLNAGTGSGSTVFTKIKSTAACGINSMLGSQDSGPSTTHYWSPRGEMALKAAPTDPEFIVNTQNGSPKRRIKELWWRVGLSDHFANAHKESNR